MSEKKPTKSRKAGSAPVSPGPMDVDLLQQIVKLMAANDLNTVDLREGQKRIVLKRGAAFAAAPSVTYAAPPFLSPGIPAQPSAGGSPPAAPPSEDAGLVPVKSPMVGTFYAKANPESKPFVSVGSTVDEDTDVCVIEAMKVFNNIKAETRGTIAKVLVSDGQTVEFGTVLFLVKP
jgi:acetyl-CoA carboxylase biotin carboxyl carrier protein